MKKAIITGATGAIGVALVRILVEKNIKVLVFCSKNSKRAANIPKHPLVEICYADLEEYDSIENVKKETYDVFFHLAWAGTTGAARNDMQLQMKNISYALDAVDMANRFGCKRFVGIGSQAEYGRKTEPLTAYMTMHPETGYGAAKLSAGYMTRQQALQYDMEHVWVRVLSVYGPYESGLISYMMKTLLCGEQPSLTEGKQIWDYLYSEDAADALIAVSEKGVSGKCYVLGSGIGRPLSEFVEEIRDVVNSEIPLEFGTVPYAENQVMYLQADISELKADTGFEPKTSFKAGVKKMLEWVRKTEG